MTDTPKILLATDVAADAALIGKLLQPEFGDIIVCDDGDRLVEDFGKHRPAVLIVAFDTLEKAERYSLGLYRRSTVVHSLPHWTLVLCNKDELLRAYELCKKRSFDDYVLFWPMMHDTPRLAMAVQQGLWRLATSAGAVHLTTQMVAEARPLLELESRLEQVIQNGKQRIESASRRLEQNPEEVAAALQPLDDWTDGLIDEFSPELQAASKLRKVAADVRPAVLVVEDDEFQQKILLELLAEIGLQPLAAASGVEAFAALVNFRPDLIFMDVNLPDIDGIEITRRLKGDANFAAVPVIMITGHSEKNVVVESLKAGASDFVVKPYDKEVLLAKIRALLKGETDGASGIETFGSFWGGVLARSKSLSGTTHRDQSSRQNTGR